VWVDLYAPSGRIYNLRGYVGGSADNIKQQYQLNLSGEPLKGTWWLRVYDNGHGDVGKIDSWSITF
jgi:subtilisin-like proprotein convertase family protein